MPRGLSTAAKAYTGAKQWAVVITTPAGVVHRFAREREQLILGNTFKPYLLSAGPFRRTRSLVSDSGDIVLDGADKTIADLIDAATWEGGECIVYIWMIGIDELVEVFRGRLTEQTVARDAVSFRIVSRVDLGQIAVPQWFFDPLCGLRFAKGICGYDRAAISVTVDVAERTSTSVQNNGITDSTLALTVNAHIDKFCVMTTGAQKGKVRRIKSNTATAVVFYNNWSTNPASGDKFVIITAANGVPKMLFTATSGLFESNVATTFTARTIGDSALAMTTDEHKSDAPDDVAGLVLISAGAGSGQIRKIKGNTGSVVTIEDSEADFNPVPDGTSKFRVLHRFCLKDILKDCEQRGRTHSFIGMPTISTELQRTYGSTSPPVGGGGGGGVDDRGSRDGNLFI